MPARRPSLREDASPHDFQNERPHPLVSIAWLLNAALLLAAFAWIFTDGHSRSSIELLYQRLGLSRLLDPTPHAANANPLAFAPDIAEVGLALAAGTFLVMFRSLFFGAWRTRSTRRWLLFTALAAGWLALFASWPQVYWRGQQHRVTAHLPAATEFAENLRADWPRQDGGLAGVGAFLAYPQPNPTTLLMLGETRIPGTPLEFSAIERTDDGSLRFELADDEHGAWLEHRPAPTPPDSFTSGLQTHYTPTRHAQLASNWHLVRYQAIGPSAH